MGAPYIKFYQLPPGYSEDADTDLQQMRDDELLPVTQKSEVLSSAAILSAVNPVKDEQLIPYISELGRVEFPLQPSGSADQEMVGVSLAEIVNLGTGPFAVEVHDWRNASIPFQAQGDADAVSPATKWSFSDTGFHFTGAGPSGVVVSCYMRAPLPATHWAMSEHLYSGQNEFFNRVEVSVDSGDYEAPVDRGDGWVETSPASSVKANYTQVKFKTKYFISEHTNWVVDHLRMNPDVFVGKYDYPGDTYEQVVNGQTVIVNPTLVPKFVERDSYQLKPREGMVVFAEAIDALGSDNAVRANFAYLVGIGNVDKIKLDPVPGSDNKRFRVDTETHYPDAHGKRWVGRRDAMTPINIYVDGQLAPMVRTVAPFEVMTIKTS